MRRSRIEPGCFEAGCPVLGPRSSVPDWNSLCSSQPDDPPIVLHNFADEPRAVHLRVDRPQGNILMNLLAQERCVADDGGRHMIELEAYGYRWLRVGDMERPIADEWGASPRR